MVTPSTVVIRGSDELEYRERTANSGPVRPGHLVEQANGGLQPHSTAAEASAPLFAIERRYTGMLADDPDGLNDEYKSSETVLYANFDGGYQVYALLASGNTVSDGTRLVSNGDGTLRPLNTSNTGETESAVVGEAVESVDASGASEPQRVRVQV